MHGFAFIFCPWLTRNGDIFVENSQLHTSANFVSIIKNWLIFNSMNFDWSETWIVNRQKLQWAKWYVFNVLYYQFMLISHSSFQILENEIKDIYSHLKIVYATESDEVLRLHSQLALEEINSIMKELLSAQLPLTKEIRILHHWAFYKKSNISAVCTSTENKKKTLYLCDFSLVYGNCKRGRVRKGGEWSSDLARQHNITVFSGI